MKFIVRTGNWICRDCFGSVTDGLLYCIAIETATKRNRKVLRLMT
jgi:hypothetical protein